MAKAMDVLPLPAAQVGWGAGEQGEGRGGVAFPPFLVGYLHGPAVLEGRQPLARLLHLALGLPLARQRRLGLAPGFFGLTLGAGLAVAGQLGLTPGGVGLVALPL